MHLSPLPACGWSPNPVHTQQHNATLVLQLITHTHSTPFADSHATTATSDTPDPPDTPSQKEIETLGDAEEEMMLVVDDDGLK